VLWMGMLPVVAVAAVTVLMRWLGDEESAAFSAADVERLLAQPDPAQRSSAWPSRPRFR